MARFWRDGHLRTNAYGYRYPVEGHWVEREDWAYVGSTASTEDYFRMRLAESNASRSTTAQFVNPNAKCPVCNEAVFYYRNEFGSSVFFDELGPPWPKHPCTDTQLFRSKLESSKGIEFVELRMRESEDISSIRYWLDELRLSLSDSSTLPPRRKTWAVGKIVKKIREGENQFIVVKVFHSNRFKTKFLQCSPLPNHIKEGSLISIRKNKISFLSSKNLIPQEILVEQIKNASEFIERIIVYKSS